MNLRQVWTEVFQKPAGRLLLFLVVGGIFLAFILLRREPQPKPDNTEVAHQATRSKGYSFDEDIPAPPRAQATPAERVSDKLARATPTPRPPSPIPQTIFVTKEQSISELFLPYGRLLRCELVNTVDSTNNYPSLAAGRRDTNQQRRNRKRLLRRSPGRRTNILQASSGAARKEPVLRSRSGRCDVLPLHHTNGGFGQSHRGTFRIARTLKQPQTAMKFHYSILLLSLVAGCATKKEVRSVQRVEVPGTTLAADDMPEVRTPETVKAYPVGRYTDPNFPEQVHERHTLYRREQSAQWNYRPSGLYMLKSLVIWQ